MFDSVSPHVRAGLQALFVTFLWSTSWVLIKVGLVEIPPLTFAGLRYSLAFLCLLPLALRSDTRAALRSLPARQWGRLIVLGLLFYTITQGAQFIALAHLPAITLNLLLSFTSITVALLAIPLLRERPAPLQWAGALLSLAGALLYFYPVTLPAVQRPALVVALVGVLANALSAILGRSVNRAGVLPPLLVTVASMGVGGICLLVAGLLLQGLPRLMLLNWLVIVWLALVNTAFAFTWWNLTLRTLSAMESSIINSTMLVQIPLLALLFLGESLSPKEGGGLLLAGVGALLVQLRAGGGRSRQGSGGQESATTSAGASQPARPDRCNAHRAGGEEPGS